MDRVKDKYLPIRLWTILNWAAIESCNFASCTTMAFTALISDVKGHAKGLLMGLSVRLNMKDNVN